MMVICIKQFMEKLSNTDAELKKSVAYKKKRVVLSCRRVSYSRPFTHDIVTRNNTTHSDIFIHTSIGKEVDEESNKKT